MRKAAFAGSFYPKSIDSLNKVLEDCFTAKLGPGAVPVKPIRPEKPLKAVIVPHAGYAYSGMAAAWAYSAISDCAFCDALHGARKNQGNRDPQSNRLQQLERDESIYA